MTLMPTSRYKPVVRIGNWFEDICLEQEKTRTFKFQRDKGLLLVEKTRQLFDNFHKEIELGAPKKNVHFGAIVQLMPFRMNLCNVTTSTSESHPALSIIINERVVRHSQRINDECELTIAGSMKPVVRNSFRIISGDDRDRTNEVLNYGQQFRLECVDNTEGSLLLFSAAKMPDLGNIIHTTFESQKFGEINLPLGLVWRRNCGPNKTIPMAYCNFSCKHIDPRKRFETDGFPLPSNKPLVLTHVATNRNLAAENVIIQTLFGPEFLVSVQNYRDIHHREKWQNVWMICNGHQFK